MPKPITADERARILQLHGEGLSRNAIMRATGRSAGLVTKVVQAAGLTFERAPEVQVATKAKQVDNAAKRAVLEERFLDEAALLLDQLHQPHRVFNFGGKDNTYEERLLDAPDVGAKHTLMRAAGTAVDKAIRLADVDKATAGADVGKSLVVNLWGALGAAEEETDETPDQ